MESFEANFGYKSTTKKINHWDLYYFKAFMLDE